MKRLNELPTPSKDGPAQGIAGSLRRGRQLAGVLLKDWRRYERALSAGDDSYLGLCNRDEGLEAAPDGRAFRCLWQWTSDLHAPKLLPALGRRLAQRALAAHPIRRQPAASASAKPELSFLIGHRGAERIPHLLATLETIAAQHGAEVECIVVEQDEPDRLSALLPGWVRHLHTPPPAAGMPYCRAWAFNVAARHARGEVLVLHDNDMLVPVDYAAEALRILRSGHEVANLKRFIFYLSEQHTRRVFAGEAGLLDEAPQAIVQNLEGGGSVAISRSAYFAIGGLDESFVGWGGEDNEFWERALTLKAWPFGFLPLVHLWHPAQAGKQSADNETLRHYRELSRIDPAERVARLSSLPAGELSGPAGLTCAA